LRWPAASIAAGFLLLAAAGTMTAATEATGALNGYVVSFSSHSLAIETAAEDPVTFTLAPRIAIPSGLQVGDRVDVVYATLPDGSHRAKTIRIQTAGFSPRPDVRSETGTGSGMPSPAAGRNPSLALVAALSLSAACGGWLIAKRPA